MLLDGAEERRLHREVMNRVVPAVIQEIAEDEARVERLADPRAHREGVERIEEDPERDAEAERHHEAILVIRKVVMNAVEEEVNPPAARRVLEPVKDVAV